MSETSNDEVTIIETLKYFGKIYHTYFGFSNKPNLEIYALADNEKECSFWSNYADQEEKDGDEIWFSLSHQCIVEDANENTPYDKVILSLPSNAWTTPPKYEWYNEPTKWWIPHSSDNDKVKKNCANHLPYLSAYSYITVVKPFYEVHIDKEKKGCPITINDILFAARGLAPGDTSVVASVSFNVISKDIANNTIELRPITLN